MKRAIEEYFPIVDINRLAVPERNAFKPIYTMHKWFARRSSSVFRAILLAAMKPAGTDIMKEFYKDHTNDPDTKGKVILDPFMGGGTTVVEALRLGCKVIGIDLNPVAWFIVKTEVEPVDLGELQEAFDRLAERHVDWSGKPLKETLLSLYKTECPACGNTDADIIYTFWVKLAPCTTGTCRHETPLFSDYLIAQKKPSIRYLPDCECPECGKRFDWEKDSATLVGDVRRMRNSGQFSAGEGRTSARWAYSAGKTVHCPWCERAVTPTPKKLKPVRKKVMLSVLFCPHCEEVWQFRGELPESVECPSCSRTYNPNEGNLPDKGKFVCHGTCNGNVDAVISAIRTLPNDQLLRMQSYGIEGYCKKCAGIVEADKESSQTEIFDAEVAEDDNANENDFETEDIDKKSDLLPSILRKNHGKFLKRVGATDIALYQKAQAIWEEHKVSLPYPKSEIPVGEKTKSGLLAHHYRYWHQMFNDRQLLALTTLLRAISDEGDQSLKEMLLSCFEMTVEANNMFTWNISKRSTPGGMSPGGVFRRHDFHPKMRIVEQNVWGTASGRNTFQNRKKILFEAKEFIGNPVENVVDKNGKVAKQIYPGDGIQSPLALSVVATSSTKLSHSDGSVDFIITDPPYAGNVNYAELSDFFHVWLRLVLASKYPEFAPEYTPKVEEIIENRTRGKSNLDFEKGLTAVFSECCRVLRSEGTMTFTFHHADDAAWESLLAAVCNAGFLIEAVYPIHGEAENSLHLIGNEAISYDLIHVCRKRESQGAERRSWASIRQEVRQRAREEVRSIESGRYGNEPLSPADINILLIGKCLELYSKHYGAVVDYKDQPVPLRIALEEIKMLVDQLVAREQPLPSELEDLLNSDPPDRVSYVYFRALCGNREIKSDDVNKYTRGIIEVSELKDAGLLVKGREQRGRTFEVKQPVERLNELKEKFIGDDGTVQTRLFDGEGRNYPTDIPFVDYVHLLLGLAETGENVLPWLERFRGLRPQIRAALEYLTQRNKNFSEPARKILGLIDARTLFTTQQ